MNAVNEILQQNEITLQEVIKYSFEENANRFLGLDTNSYNKYCSLYKKLDDAHKEKKDCNSTLKGNLLETLSSILLSSGEMPLLEIMRNKRTSTNEIDLLVEWTAEAKFASIHNIYSFFGDCFLCECKNYNGRVSVTYVGKFYSLLNVSRSKLGILFSWEGVSGRSKWSDANGLIKKIALKEGIYIIDFNKDDFKDVYDNKIDFYSIIKNKYMALKNDISYEDYIEKHELEKDFKKI